MKDIVTFETARMLKDMGFPQPAPAPGQVLYTANGVPFVIIVVFVDLDFFFAAWLNDTGKTTTGKIISLLSCTYAPTAPDILRELGEDWTMIVAGGGFQIYKHFQDPQYIFPVSANDNPAEACAMAWEASQK